MTMSSFEPRLRTARKLNKLSPYRMKTRQGLNSRWWLHPSLRQLSPSDNLQNSCCAAGVSVDFSWAINAELSGAICAACMLDGATNGYFDWH